MSSRQIQSNLDIIEAHIHQVTQLLQQPASADLTLACSLLQATVLDFSRLMQQELVAQAVDIPLKLRLHKTAFALSSCREHLLRRAALTQSALSTLMPATRSDTYAPATGGYARQPYGSAGRQSGEFRMASA